MGIWLFQSDQSYYTALQGRIRLHASLHSDNRQLAIGHRRQRNRAHSHSAYTERPCKSGKRPFASRCCWEEVVSAWIQSEMIIRRFKRSTAFNRPEDICAMSIIPRKIFAAVVLSDETCKYDRKNRSYGRNLHIPNVTSSSFTSLLYHDLQIIEHR